MKRYLIVIFALCSLTALQTHAKPKQCYCSIKCGPRDVGAVAGDNPTYSTITLPSGEEQTICFCQQRDKDNYIKNKCYKEKNQDQTNACDTKKKRTKKSKQYEEPMRLRY